MTLNSLAPSKYILLFGKGHKANGIRWAKKDFVVKRPYTVRPMPNIRKFYCL